MTKKRKKRSKRERIEFEIWKLQRDKEREELFSKRLENEVTLEALERAKRREVRYVV